MAERILQDQMIIDECVLYLVLLYIYIYAIEFICLYYIYAIEFICFSTLLKCILSMYSRISSHSWNVGLIK